MTFEEFEKASPERLRELVRARFEQARTAGHSWGGTPALLLEAQFYMAEIDRRESSSVARRDFWMELFVIALIALELVASGWGIWFAARESREQAQVMERVIKALEAVERSTSH